MRDIAALNYVQTMTVRVDLATKKTVETIAAVLDAALFYANTIKSRGLSALSDALEMAQDAANEAGSNAQQLTSSAAQLQWSSVFTIETIITIADPYVFNSVVCKNSLIVAPIRVDLDKCLLVVSSVIQPDMFEFSGQGLTAFNPSSSDQQNVIHMVLRNDENVYANWITKDNIHLELAPECALDGGLALTFYVTQHGSAWCMTYCVTGASIGTCVKINIEVMNVVVRQCNMQVM